MIKMVVTDLDGTLFNSKSKISEKDLETLLSLEKEGVVRVVATGRNLYSAQSVLGNDFPIDYLVFSTGAGIMDWKTKELIEENHLDKTIVKNIAETFIDHQVDFMIQDKIPNNHHFQYCQFNEDNNDFISRVKHYKGFERKLESHSYNDASQLLAVLEEDPKWFNELSDMFDNIKVIRATSPLNGKSIWMEIFPKHVSKAYGIRFLLNKLGIKCDETIAVGNDFNDIDFLEACPKSFVVENAPEELKKKYQVISSNDNHGFTEAVQTYINI